MRSHSKTFVASLALAAALSVSRLNTAHAQQLTVALLIRWTDTSNNETEFEASQHRADGSFNAIARVGANVTQYRAPPVTGPIGSNWCYAVRAVANTTEGELFSPRAEGCWIMTAIPPSAPIDVIAEPPPP